MSSESNYFSRKSIRLTGYDYSQNGLYFVTICTNFRSKLFGNVLDGKMVLNKPGVMIKLWWEKLEIKYKEISVHDYVVMPNHIHGVLLVTQEESRNQSSHPAEDNFRTLIDGIQWFKTMTTNNYIAGVKTDNWEIFQKKLWQRSFHDRIVRQRKELEEILEYIQNNPLKWDVDSMNTKL